MSLPHHLVLLDLDGTLSDPLEGIGRSINFALSHFGYAELPLSDIGVYIGPPLDQAFTSITGARDKNTLNALVAKYRERYGDTGYTENVVYEGIPQVLRDLTDAGVRLGLCTSKRADYADKILRRFGLRQHFDFISGGDIGIEKWQQIQSLLGAGKIDASTVMVGDRAVDITAARSNGLQAAGVLWGYGSRHELEAESPQYLLSRPEELLAFGRRSVGTGERSMASPS